MMFGLYCRVCRIQWPNLSGYKRCPVCEFQTKPATGKPLSQLDALKLVNQAHFDTFYKARESEREGPTPEEVGQIEAEEEIKVWRGLRQALDMADNV